MNETISKWIEEHSRNTELAPAKIAALLKDSGVSAIDAYEAVKAFRIIGELKMKSLRAEEGLLRDGEDGTGVSEEIIRECIDTILIYPAFINYRVGQEVVKAYNIDDKKTA